MPRDQQLPSLFLILYLMLAGQAFASKALAISDDVSDATILANGKSGTALVDKLMGNVSSLGTYKYDGTQEAQTGKKVLKASGTFYYKPTDLMRVEVKQFGSKSGSILVKSPEGKIKAKGGPQMLGIKMSLAPDSRLLQMPNGLSAFECNLSSLFGRLKKEAASGCKILCAEQPIQLENLGKAAIVIESQMASDSGAKVVDRIFVDPSLKVPIQWDQFENGKFLARSKFQNYQTNMRLDDSLFSM
jgi:outer membrane lipoprotein-sorting protein